MKIHDTIEHDNVWPDIAHLHSMKVENMTEKFFLIQGWQKAWIVRGIFFCKSDSITVYWKWHLFCAFTFVLTPCRRATRKLMIALPCVVDGSWVSLFPYATSCTRVCQLVWRTSCFKVIDSLMQDVRSQVTNKQTSPDPLFLEPEDCNKVTTHSDSLSVYLQLQSWLCVGVFCKRTILCASYMRIHILISLIIVTVKVWTLTVMSPQLVHVSNCDLLLVHWPHNFYTHFSSHISRQFL
jgi:hypothetical protein